MVLANNDPGTPETVVVVAVVHYVSWAVTRADPSKHVGNPIASVDIVVVVAVHHISWAAARAGLSNHVGHHMRRAERRMFSWAAARPGQSSFERMVRVPVRPIKFLNDGPRPTQPITFSIFHGPAWSVKRFRSARPGAVRINGQRCPEKRSMTISLINILRETWAVGDCSMDRSARLSIDTYL